MSAPEESSNRVSMAGLVILSGVLTASFRFLATVGFNNDHFVHLSAAQQMLFGDWPSRDFIDIGRPLTIVASAAVQYLFGHTLFAEALLVSAGFGVAAALTAATVFELTNSLPLSLGAVAFELAAFPRAYSYPKVLMTAGGIWLICRFVRRPTTARQMMMAAGVAIAFLFRHDLGVFVGAGGLVASALVAPETGWGERGRRGVAFLAMVAAMVIPYLVYVQLTDGLRNYVVTALDANRAEAGYVWPNPFEAAASPESRLLYVFHLLPMVTIGLCAKDWRKGWRHWSSPLLVSVAVVAMTENFGLMRDLLKARVPDAIVPAVVLGAWLMSRAWARWPLYGVIPATFALLGAGVLVGGLGDIGENADRAGLTGETLLHPWSLSGRFSERSAKLSERFGSDPPSPVVPALMPFFSYLDRCTTPRHRLFLAGMIPEVAYYARRPFAGGGYEHYNYGSRANQQRVANRLRREVVPFALIPSEAAQELEEDLPIVGGFFRGRYVPLTDVAVSDDRHIRILVDSNLPSTSRDSETGWPCFRSELPR
jgi:hypothetical protein